MAEMNRRTMLKVACAIPIIGGFSKLFATEVQEYIRIHTLFCDPIIGLSEFQFWNPRIQPNEANLHELKRNLKDHIKELRKIPSRVIYNA